MVKLPLPPANFPTLWQQDDRFKESYLAEFPGYYKTADAGYKDEDGYIFVMSRTDDIINVAGHRLSTGGMEEVLAGHPDVAECAVLGIKDELKGEVPCGFIVLKAGVNRPPAEIEKEIVALVRDKIGPVAAFKLAITVARLPKTRSGKILRGTIKKIADGEKWTMPATIDDPVILDEIGARLRRTGLGVRPLRRHILKERRSADSRYSAVCAGSVIRFTFDRMQVGDNPQRIKGGIAVAKNLTVETAEYVLSQTKELAQLSRGAGLKTLAYWLELAVIEGETQLKDKREWSYTLN